MHSKLFYLLIVSNIIMLTLESAAWILEGQSGLAMYHLNYWTNYLLLMFNPLPIVIWLFYVDYFIFRDIYRLGKRFLLYLSPLIFSTCLMIITLYNGFVFTIDGQNHYHRGPGILFMLTMNITILLMVLAYSFKHRRRIDGRSLRTFQLFSILPIIGVALQIMFYGTLFIWSAMAIALVILFIHVEFRRINSDYLTGLSNRRQLDDYISYRIKYAKRNENFSLLMIDADNFKPINDQYGHDEGDNAIVTLSEIIKHSLRANDMIARYAGDEFVAVIDSDDELELRIIINRIRSSITDYNERGIKPYTLNVSVGASSFDKRRHRTCEDLLKDADRKMYEDKKRKKATIQ